MASEQWTPSLRDGGAENEERGRDAAKGYGKSKWVPKRSSSTGVLKPANADDGSRRTRGPIRDSSEPRLRKPAAKAGSRASEAVNVLDSSQFPDLLAAKTMPGPQKKIALTMRRPPTPSRCVRKQPEDEVQRDSPSLRELMGRRQEDQRLEDHMRARSLQQAAPPPLPKPRVADVLPSNSMPAQAAGPVKEEAAEVPAEAPEVPAEMPEADAPAEAEIPAAEMSAEEEEAEEHQAAATPEASPMASPVVRPLASPTGVGSVAALVKRHSMVAQAAATKHVEPLRRVQKQQSRADGYIDRVLSSNEVKRINVCRGATAVLLDGSQSPGAEETVLSDSFLAKAALVHPLLPLYDDDLTRHQAEVAFKRLIAAYRHLAEAAPWPRVFCLESPAVPSGGPTSEALGPEDHATFARLARAALEAGALEAGLAATLRSLLERQANADHLPAVAE